MQFSLVTRPFWKSPQMSVTVRLVINKISQPESFIASLDQVKFLQIFVANHYTVQ